MSAKVHLKVGELFSGAGGLGLGFALAEHRHICFQPVFAVDNDPNSLRTYRTNFGWLHEASRDRLPQLPRAYGRDVEHLNLQALLRLAKLKVGELDLLIGGPPCQGFSSP